MENTGFRIRGGQSILNPRAIAVFFWLLSPSAFAKTVHYELTATRGEVNLSGKKTVDFALLLNGSLPAPVLEFNEGDDAEIVVKNRIPGEELSIHWHGILLPNEMDGVPYVTSPSIFPGQDYTYRFRLRQSGTYWYHSHTNLQEQKGVYGAIVIHPDQRKVKNVPAVRDLVLLLSDWSDENADQILANLKKDGDYYLYKKSTVRSWYGALKAGKLGSFLGNEWTRMGGMDLSDVGYDAFLINGRKTFDASASHLRPGERVRLRIINASASTYFHVTLGQEPMTVVSADGVDIDPVKARKLLMGMAETYDVIFTVPDRKSTELRVTAQDGTGSASAWLGTGEKVLAPVEPMPDLYLSHSGENHVGHGDQMDHSGHSGHGGHAGHASHEESTPTVDVLTVDSLRAAKPTAFDKKPTLDLKLALGGDMSRYVWYINGKSIHEERNVDLREGDIVRITFENQTMMHHPMHLHGHFFRVLNAAGERSPLKHTVDVPPHGTRTIEFRAEEPGQWLLHCHNLYHMKSGMARVVRYLSYRPKPEIERMQPHDPHHHDHWYITGMAELASNHALGSLRLSQSRSQFDLRVEGRNTTGENFSWASPWELESDLFYRRWFSRYLNLVSGAHAHRSKPRNWSSIPLLTAGKRQFVLNPFMYSR